MRTLVCFGLMLLASATVFATDANPILPSVVKPFSLPDINGEIVTVSPDDAADFTVLCFLGTECPLARLYGPRLQVMADQFADADVRFVGVNSNIQDSMDEIRHYAKVHEIRFPLAKDYDRSVALAVAATRTPEVIVIDRVGVVRYRGRIDDQYEPGIARDEATRHDLRDAIESLVAGKVVADPTTTPVGCLIALPRTVQQDASVTYCDQISRVLQKHCVECHRAGEIGPFALDDYDEVVGWADMSLEVIDQHRMPPWHAAEGHAPLANARSMPESDKKLLRDWVDAGMPYGSAADRPEPTTYVDGWQLPQQPDLVLAMSKTPFEIPADQTVEYQYYVVDADFETDRWVKAAEVIPGNRAAVHHSIAFVRPPDGADFREIRLLSAYVPGQRRSELPDGYAQRIPAGSRIIFQMHYTPTGKPETDITRIGLVFAEESDVTHEVVTLGGIEQDFEIPPGEARYTVNGTIGYFPRNGELLSIMPHMHLRGKSFSFAVVRGTQSRTLLEVPAYDFNWQHNYAFADSVKLADVDELSFTATFDNSTDNPTNPDPTEYVTWGDQTWQEMAVTFVAVAVPRQIVHRNATPVQTVVAGSVPDPVAETKRREKAIRFADDYFAKFDKNDDGAIHEDELPHSVRIFAFHSFDHNRDQSITKDEIQSESDWRNQ
ncbi:hypothetical protein Poly51_10270 [Rubripirellula tenax]|uniref:Thiol-disulfide oxidoreductase n=1 Tax=Rubripirellula tenax TaxID=2528015 RepID=A0A5C6FG39_9BACT|nr:redoxin domain-containing protein [Rubripirellula tenax]TWU60746.1 hypothetical protein Poly51_10270 [Rubripirellula tenax]